MTPDDGHLPTTHREACAVYETRRDAFLQRRTRDELRANRLSYARLGAFLTAAGGLVVGAVMELGWPILVVVEGGALAGFVGFVVLHRKALGRARRFAQLARVNEEASHRASRSWMELARCPETSPAAHPYADDLDVFGEGSLWELLARPTTVPGNRTLQEFLLAPSTPAVVAERQEAVAELAPQIGFREGLLADGRMGPPITAPMVARFLSWSEGVSVGELRAWWQYAAWLLPLTTLTLLVLQVTDALQPPLWLASVVVTLGVAWYVIRPARPIIEAAAGGEGSIDSLIGLLRAVESLPCRSVLLRRLQSALGRDGRVAHWELARLQRVLRWAEVRFSGSLHFVLQFTLLWDVHVLFALERWRARSGRHARAWIDVVGEFEALAALAALRHAHPEWAFPRVGGDELRGIDAVDLGHPLLPVDRCVTNDVRIDGEAPLLVVTGSNMSGKSTLLRAIGVNVVLANAGGPVCASRFALGRPTLFTSMRVRDSLTEGVSQFMAELQRLKRAVVTAAEVNGKGGGLFFLLDDVLYGTTATERRKAVEVVLGRLLRHGAVGAIAGHDLPIDERTPFWSSARVVHLREDVRGEGDDVALAFDYKLRPGRATGGTAMKLLAQLGLE